MRHSLSAVTEIPFIDLSVYIALMESIPYVREVFKIKADLHGFTALRSTSKE